MAERDEQEFASTDLVDQPPIADSKLVQALELGSLQRQRSVLLERCAVEFPKLALDLLFNLLVDPLELLDEVMEVEDLHYFIEEDRKSTRLNSSHSQNSYAVFC